MSSILYRIFALCLFLVALLLPASAQAQEDVIRKMLIDRDHEIKALLGDKKTLTDAQEDELKELINGVIDFDRMSQDALGAEWSKLTPEQHTEFVKVFSEIVKGQSLADLDIYRLNMTIGDIKVDDDSAHVETTTVYKEKPMNVAYALGFRGNEWRVDDIILDGVSTTEGYARSFQTYVRKRGFDALMASLHKKLDKMSATG
ncbi:MAG: ABC transporter substrate-binding protein [Rhodothermales bacterium]